MKKLITICITLVIAISANAQQNVGIGTNDPKSKLDINGGLTIGSGYAGSVAAPTNGAIIEGPVGIGTTNPDSKAALDVNSTTQGILVPRMSTTQRNAISSPATGLTIYNTTLNCMEYFNGTGWLNHCTGAITAPTGGNASSGGTAVVLSWTSTVGCSVGAGTNNSPAGVIRGGVNETMVQGVAAPATASITLVANVTSTGTYTISTNTLNGVTFSASGTFGATGSQTVTLTPTGTPTAAGNFKWATVLTPSIDVYGSVISASSP